uniref:Secreted protein n=1 Tax=Setaria digitata TaxID=48799 RepID=A0A915PTW0_9BILA
MPVGVSACIGVDLLVSVFVCGDACLGVSAWISIRGCSDTDNVDTWMHVRGSSGLNFCESEGRNPLFMINIL